VNELVALVADVAGKTVKIRHVEGPVGVHARNHSSARIRALGWTDRHSLRDGLAKTYPWVKEQTERALARGEAV
jgi:nucleoside-diphosphate-sugar epimerase